MYGAGGVEGLKKGGEAVRAMAPDNEDVIDESPPTVGQESLVRKKVCLQFPHKKIGIRGGHASTHGGPARLVVVPVAKSEVIVSQDKFGKLDEEVGAGFGVRRSPVQVSLNGCQSQVMRDVSIERCGVNGHEQDVIGERCGYGSEAFEEVTSVSDV